jgi:Sulfatase
MCGSRQMQAAKSIAMGSVLAANIFLFMPLTLYMGNVGEFTVPFSAILDAYRWPAFLFLVLLGVIGALCKAERFTGYLSVLAVISILLWVQGNLLVWEYGLLDGRSIDWEKGAWRGWTDLGLWSVFLLLVLFSGNPVRKLFVHAAVAVFCLQICFSLLFAFRNAEAFSEKSMTVARDNEVDDIYRFSSRKNVLHILADGFQSDIFEEIFNGGDGETLSRALDGFVFFKENMGAFQYTHMSVPAILSGKVYRNQVPQEQFLDEAIGGKTILNAAYRAGYEVDLAVPPALQRMYAKSQYTNFYLVPSNLHVTSSEYKVRDASKLFDLTLFRVAPHFLKRYVYNNQRWFVQTLLGDKKSGQQFFSHKAFLRHISENMSVDRDAPVYKYLHLMLSHNPMVTTEDCEYAGVLPSIRDNIKNQARCGLIEVAHLLEKMKELGIYDNATIVLQGDHGTWVTPMDLEGKSHEDKNKFIVPPAYVGEALPLMAIKIPHASGSMKTSLVLSSITDTAETIASIIGLDARFVGRSIFDVQPGEPRERKHYLYEYERSEWAADYLDPMQEYVVNGSAYDSAAWRLGDKFLPEGAIEVARH